MKLNHIYDVTEQCKLFTNRVIGLNESLCYTALMERIRMYCDAYTEHRDDTINIDYRDMCFTVHTNENKEWELCENATYYVLGTNGCVEEAIDIELN